MCRKEELFMSDMRKLRTDKEIFNAFKSLLEKKPFSEITMIELAREAQVHRNTMYKHFVDKYDLLRKLVYNELKNNQDLMNMIETQPFKAIAGFYKVGLANIIDRQENDTEFNMTIQQSALKLLYMQKKDDEILWKIGTISSIFIWNELHDNALDIVADYQTLDQIYQTKKFPKIDK